MHDIQREAGDDAPVVEGEDVEALGAGRHHGLHAGGTHRLRVEARQAREAPDVPGEEQVVPTGALLLEEHGRDAEAVHEA